jgi:hypothetical protein
LSDQKLQWPPLVTQAAPDRLGNAIVSSAFGLCRRCRKSAAGLWLGGAFRGNRLWAARISDVRL